MYENAASVYVQLMGRGQIAGHIKKTDTEGFWELTVPATSVHEQFVKIFSDGAIFAITDVTEEQVLCLAENLKATPVDNYYLRENAIDVPPDTDYDDEESDDDYWEDADELYGDEDEDYDEAGDDDGEPEAVLAL